MFKPSKTNITYPKKKYLGHILSKEGIAPDPDKSPQVGKKFIDSENEGLYEVTEIFYNPEFNVVVGKISHLMDD
jgi:hypothetical protein